MAHSIFEPVMTTITEEEDYYRVVELFLIRTPSRMVSACNPHIILTLPVAFTISLQ